MHVFLKKDVYDDGDKCDLRSSFWTFVFNSQIKVVPLQRPNRDCCWEESGSMLYRRWEESDSTLYRRWEESGSMLYRRLEAAAPMEASALIILNCEL